MNDPTAKPRPSSSAPTDEITTALREWAEWTYRQATRAAQARNQVAPPQSLSDWRRHCGTLERRLIEAAISAGIFDPDEAE